MKSRRFWQGEKSEKRLKRELFFDEIQQSAFQVNESLRTEIYIPYKSVIPHYDNPQFEELDDLAREHFWNTHPNSKWSDYEHLHKWDAFLMADDNHYPELIPVREAVVAWSRKYHLDADWCREIAVRTLFSWAGIIQESRYKDRLYDWDCPPGGVRYQLHARMEDEILPLPGFPRYLPFRDESSDDYLKEVERWMQEKIISQSIWHQLKNTSIGSLSGVRKELDKYIEEDLKRIRTIAECYGYFVEFFYSQEGYKLLPPQPEEAKHIKWAVQAQIGMKSLSDIARSENLFNGNMPNVSYVKREVTKILKTIELAPRKELLRRGRPKGTKDKAARRRATNR